MSFRRFSNVFVFVFQVFQCFRDFHACSVLCKGFRRLWAFSGIVEKFSRGFREFSRVEFHLGPREGVISSGHPTARPPDRPPARNMPARPPVPPEQGGGTGGRHAPPVTFEDDEKNAAQKCPRAKKTANSVIKTQRKSTHVRKKRRKHVDCRRNPETLGYFHPTLHVDRGGGYLKLNYHGGGVPVHVDRGGLTPR